MPEPLTIAGILAATGAHIYYHVIGGAVHHRVEHFLERWREAAIDPATGLPRNHDLREASEASLRAALKLLILELAGRFDPDKPWLKRAADKLNRWAATLPLGPLLTTDLTSGGTDPHHRWLDLLWQAVTGEPFNELHSYLVRDSERLRHHLAGGDPRQALDPCLAEAVLAWAARHVWQGLAPADFPTLVRDGWSIRREPEEAASSSESPAPRITLAQAYCLFFREHLKSNPAVFRIFNADTLNAVRTELDRLGANVTGDLKTLREAVARLAANPPGFTAFEAWLTPHLGAINDLLAGVNTDLDRLARGQDELKGQRGDILVAITTLRSELARGNTDAQAPLTELTGFIAGFERKLDYLLAGLPILPFTPPDPPTRELQLLQAKHRAVELLGRRSDLDALCAWLETEEPISARLLVGSAGTGKTRLAFELLLRVNTALPGWQAGLVTDEALRRFDATKQPADWRWHQPALVVVDYAQTLAGSLDELLRALTHKRKEGLPPLRLLLLERQPGDWFEDLLRKEDSHGPCPVRNLFHPPQPVPLTPLPQGELRRRIFSETLAKATPLTGRPPPALPGAGQDEAFEQSLARDLFDQPLNLMMAALAASELGLSAALRRERVDLAEVLAEKELRRVERFARDPRNEAQKRLVRHLTACATVERGFSTEELARAVDEELGALGLEWPNGPGDLAGVLRQALPGNQLPVAPVEPDFIGEAMVLLELAQPNCSTGPERWRTWCATIVRSCRRDARATPATLLHAFQNFGVREQHGEALLAATDALIQTSLAETEPELLLGLEAAMPYQTVALRSRAAEITRNLHRRLRTLLERGRENFRPEVARLSNNLANRLGELGRRAEALAPAQEAVDLDRALVARNPHAFTPALAISLNNLAILLGELGRRAEALAPAQEAVDLNRSLAVQNPHAFTPVLASSLNTLAVGLSGLGRQVEALALAQEAVDLKRALAAQNPDVFTPDLARSLGVLGDALEGNERASEALDCVAEGVRLLRPYFLALPEAHLALMEWLMGEYERVAQTLGHPPDGALLGPVVEVVQRLKNQGPPQAGGSGPQ